MPENDYEQEIGQLLDSAECEIQVPASLRARFCQRGPMDGRHDDRRVYTRNHYPSRAVLEVKQSCPAIPREHQHFRVYTTDLSRGGMGLLHASPLYPGEVVTVWLPTSKFRVQVARCLRHRTRCFEIGVRFA